MLSVSVHLLKPPRRQERKEEKLRARALQLQFKWKQLVNILVLQGVGSKKRWRDISKAPQRFPWARHQFPSGMNQIFFLFFFFLLVLLLLVLCAGGTFSLRAPAKGLTGNSAALKHGQMMGRCSLSRLSEPAGRFLSYFNIIVLFSKPGRRRLNR